MNRRILWIISLTALLVSVAACGDEGQTCGEGTVADGSDCVAEVLDQIECGPGTTLEDGACVADEVEEILCGEGTTLTGGECVADEVEIIECGEGTELVGTECVDATICGPDTELVDGECVSSIIEIECGDGTIEVDGTCELIDPFDGIQGEPDEPNDPVLFEDADFGVLELGAPGETVLRTGNIDEAVEVGEGEEAFLAADFDVFVFEGVGGTRLTFEATAVDAPELAVMLLRLPEGDEDAPFFRTAFAFGSRNASKEVVLPFDGNYMVRIGTAVDTANFLGLLTDGQINVGGIAGDPTGAVDFTWILGVTVLDPKDPETFAGNGTFTFEGDVREAPEAFVDVEGGTIIQLGLETSPAVGGAFLTGDSNFENVEENVGLLVVPEGGLSIVVDSIFDRAVDTSFTLTAIEQPRIPQGELAVDGEIGVEGTLVGNTLQFFPFTTTEPLVVSASAAPGEGSDANLGLFLTDNDINVIAVSNDDVFGAASNEESLQAFLLPGDYQFVVLHELQDDENLDRDFVLDFSAQGVTNLGALAVDAELTASDDTLALADSTAFFTFQTDTLGLIEALATPGLNLDIDLDVFDNPFLAARDQILSALDANDGFEGEGETGSLAAGAGGFIVRLANVGGQDLEADFGADLSVTLGEIVVETEPNDDAGEPDELGTLDDVLRVGGELAADVDTTIDFYTFEVTDITDVTIQANPVGENPAAGMLLTLFDDDDIIDPIAQAETFEDFFSGQVFEPVITAVLEPGVYVVTVQQIDDEATGNYLLEIFLEDIFLCVPGAARCDEEDNVEVCADGFDFDITECGEGFCNQIGNVFGCDIVGEEEANNGPEEANDLGEINGVVERIGEIIVGDDEDWYTFTVADRAVITVFTEAIGDSVGDTILDIFDGEENLLANDDDFPGRGLFSEVSVEADGPATFFVRVTSFGANTGNYNVVFDVVVAECADGDPAVCGEEGILGCDGFLFEVVELCGFGCEEGEGGPECIVPDFIPEEEPNNGPNLDFNLIDEVPFLGFGTIEEPGDDQDWYVLEVDLFTIFDISTASAGDEENDVDTRLFVCEFGQAVGDGCSFGEGNLAFNDDIDSFNGNFYSGVSVALDPGTYFVVVESFSTGTGDYLLAVDEITETEPNGDGETAEQIEEAPFVGTGFIDFDDEDFYAFSVENLVRVDFEVASRGGEDFDSIVFVCAAADVATCEDDAIDSDDDGGNGAFSRLVVDLEAGDYFFLVRGLDDLSDSGDYIARVNLVPNEPNDNSDQASELTVGAPVRGEINPGTDEDFYALEISEAQVGVELTFITFLPEGSEADVDTRMMLCTVESAEAGDCERFGDTLAEDDDIGGGNFYSSFTFTFQETGTFIVMVDSFSTETGDYAVAVFPPGEPNNNAEDATDISLGDNVDAAIEVGDDIDFYVFEVTDGDLGVEFTFTTSTLGNDNDVDTRMMLCTPESAEAGDCVRFGDTLAENDDIGFPNTFSEFAFTFDEAGIFFVAVDSFSTNTGEYNLSLTDPR